jgi:hypothetical protein
MPSGARRAGLQIRVRNGAFLALVVAALFVLNLSLHYPGGMNNDSIQQYAEAVSGRYSDWHPPVMAWLWSLLRHVGDGAAPFLVLHLLLYWTGFGLLADSLRRSGFPRLAVLMALAGAFPPFLYLNATVSKDVGMVSSWIAAIGLIFWYRVQDRRIGMLPAAAIAALLLYGTLVRSNAVFALGPLLAYALAPARWLRAARLVACAAVIAVLAIPATQLLNRTLFQPQPRYAIQSLFLFDLLGVARHAGEPRLLEPRATLTADELSSCYTPYWWDSLSPWGRCGDRVHRGNDGRVTFGDGLALQWVTTIGAHPMAYAQHRLKHFNSEILFIVPSKHIRLTPEYRTGDPLHPPPELVTEREVKFDLVRKNPFVWPVTWLAWGIGLLFFLAREPALKPVLLARALLVSALGYSFAYLAIGVATDMRYHYWSLIAALVASVLVAPQLAEGLRRRSRALIGTLAGLALVTAIGVAARLADWQVFTT